MPVGFVSIDHADGGFTFNNERFLVSGANCYYMLTRACDDGLRQQVEDVLTACCALNVNVLRMWCYCDGPQWHALQPQPGVVDEGVARGLDWVLHACQQRQLKVILTFTNYWSDFGGMAQYVRWAGMADKDTYCTDHFYTSATCQQWFRTFCHAIITRRNTITGQLYRDDGTIMAWEIANEPRCSSDKSGATLQAWLESTSAFVKSIDANHLVTVGLDGFFGASIPDLMAMNAGQWCGEVGCDFARNVTTRHIDFASIHMWPWQWSSELPCTDARCLHFATQWIDSHAACCAALQPRKPLLLSEFGCSGPEHCRATYFKHVYENILQHMQRRSTLQGGIFWMLASHSYPDYDGYTVYIDSSNNVESRQNTESATQSYAVVSNNTCSALTTVDIIHWFSNAVQQMRSAEL